MKRVTLIALVAGSMIAGSLLTAAVAAWLGVNRVQGPGPPPPGVVTLAQMRRGWGGRARGLDYDIDQLGILADQIAAGYGVAPMDPDDVPETPDAGTYDRRDADPTPLVNHVRSIVHRYRIERNAYHKASQGDYKPLEELESLRDREDARETSELLQEIGEYARRIRPQ